jgi:hypothetical protein
VARPLESLEGRFEPPDHEEHAARIQALLF